MSDELWKTLSLYGLCFWAVLFLVGGFIAIILGIAEASTVRDERGEAARAGAVDTHKEKE